MNETLEMLDFFDYEIENRFKRVSSQVNRLAASAIGISDWDLNNILAQENLDFGMLSDEQQDYLVSFLMP